MDNLNIFQKARIILLVLIIISSIVLIISIIKTKNTKNYSAQETFSEIKEIKNDLSEKVENQTELGETQENEDTSWDEQDVEETKVDMENEDNAEENNKASYYLKINYTANVVTAYKKDSAGKYTVPVKAMVCSTGTATPTSGVYKMSNKYRWHQLNGGVYGQYCSRITGHILFHSVPYSKNKPDSLKYTAYDKLGTKASAGCIRLTVADAMWIYNNCTSGTYVEFYSSSDPGPLGKPTAQKISSNEKCRNWDPTDPSKENPWHTYVESTSTKTEKTKTENNKPKEENGKQEEQKTENNQTQTQDPQENTIPEINTEEQPNNETNNEIENKEETEDTSEPDDNKTKDNNTKIEEHVEPKEDDNIIQENSSENSVE